MKGRKASTLEKRNRGPKSGFKKAARLSKLATKKERKLELKINEWVLRKAKVLRYQFLFAIRLSAK